MIARRTKFYLDKRNGKLMGVCAGIADFTGFDVTIIRISVVVLVLFGVGWPVALYLVVGFIAHDKPRELAYDSPEETKFWQGVRTRPGNSVRDVRSRFRDLDRRLADIETHVTSHNRRLADEIDSLR